jgi:hypothetical protein
MDVNEHERLSNFTLKTQIKMKEQLVVRKGMDVMNTRDYPTLHLDMDSLSFYLHLYLFLLQAVPSL